MFKPPSVYSSPEIRTSIIKSLPHILRTSSITSKVSLNLQEISPPYSSVLLLYKGDKKPPNKPCACAAWISTPSAPAVFTLKAASPNCLIITFNSSLVTERGASFA